MRKYWIVLACVALVAAIAFGALFSGWNDMREQMRGISQQLDRLSTSLEEVKQDTQNAYNAAETAGQNARSASTAVKSINQRLQALESRVNADESEATDGDTAHLVWVMYSDNDMLQDWPEVEAALNAYSAEKIGVTCEFRFMDKASLSETILDGKQYDITFTCDWWNDFATNVAAGNFRDLSGDLERYPALKDTVIDLAWSGVTVHDGIYGIPHMKDIGYEVFWILNSDYFLNQKGFDKDLYISFEDIEPYLKTYKDDYPEDYPLKIASSGLTSWQNALADWMSMDILVGLDWEAQGTDQQYVIKSALEIPAWQNRVRKLHEWFEAGYINADAATTDAMPRSEAGVVQSGQGWFGAETVWANVIQQPIYISRYDGPFISTSSVRGTMTAVSKYCEYPDAALKLIELMNTDSWYRETARYGIEDKHYIRNSDGTVIRTKLGSAKMGVQAYVQGHYTVGALEASLFPEVPTDIHQWETTMASYSEATLSVAMGFTPDLAPVEAECQAIKQVIASYRAELYTGTCDPDEVIPKMLGEMEIAGLRTVIAELQSQLDDFLASR